MTPDPRDIAACFAVNGSVTDATSHHGGHINASFIVECSGGESYLLQRINSSVFRHPQHVMENIERVLLHMNGRMPTVPRLIPTREGKNWLTDCVGEIWRMWSFFEQARALDRAHTALQVETAAAAFGAFQAALIDLPGGPLHETIADFHHASGRFVALEKAVRQDIAGRVDSVREEIAFALDRRNAASTLHDLEVAGRIPPRIVHNDAKNSNVLLDSNDRLIAIIDLDTVMPGLAPNDFGDMVRSMSGRHDEDAASAEGIEVDFELFDALARGYLSTASAFLSSDEREHLFMAGWTITLEQGVRFLADYLEGDHYYRTRRPDQNLCRCRTQFAMVASLERHRDELEMILHRYT